MRDGIYELRVGLWGMNYRMLYFFHGRLAAVLAHGLVKEREAPPRDIEEAIRRKRKRKKYRESFFTWTLLTFAQLRKSANVGQAIEEGSRQ